MRLSIALLIGIAAMFTSILLSGTVGLYINGVLAPLSIFSVVVLTLQLGAVVWSRRQRIPAHIGPLNVAVLSVPIVLGLFVPPQILGSAAIGNQSLTENESSPAWTVSTSANTDDLEPTGDQPDPLKRNVLQWRRLTTAQRDPVAVFSGQPVDVTGFVYHAPADAPTQFTVARFVVRCCIADAKATGLVVDTPGANGLSNDTWVRVQGLFAAGVVDGETSLVIKPSQVDLTHEPNTPYLDGLFAQ